MDKYTKKDCIRDTKEHISQVQFFMIQFSQALLQRAIVHDDSKLKSPEIEVFTEYTPMLKNTTYLSEEYKGFLKNMEEALHHHYKQNSHHPEHYSEGILGMNLLDIVEMLCDWKASSMRHENGDINKSIVINKERFNMDDVLTKLFQNTIKDMKW
jgi:hypothetical protein